MRIRVTLLLGMVMLLGHTSYASEAHVIFQGLIAFKETSSPPAVEAILVDARHLPPPSKTHLPNIISQAIVDHHQWTMPTHEPYMAIENGVPETSTSCFISMINGIDFEFSWETSPKTKLKAYPLCGNHDCGTIQLTVGTTDLTATSIDLSKLVAESDFSAYQCDTDLFRIDFSSGSTVARIEITKGDTVTAEEIQNSAKYAPQRLIGGIQEACTGTGKRYAEQVVLKGNGTITLTRGAKSCSFSALNPANPMKLWIFNVDAESYRPSTAPPMAHPEAFYWYYDLASKPCATVNGYSAYPSLCRMAGTAADPKCPQLLVTD